MFGSGGGGRGGGGGGGGVARTGTSGVSAFFPSFL